MKLRKLLRVILLVGTLKCLPVYAQTYAFYVMAGEIPIFKRAEKHYGNYWVSENGTTTTYTDRHIGFIFKKETSSEDEENEMDPEVRIRDKFRKSKQILSGMNYNEVAAIKEPYYKIVNGYEETWYFRDDSQVIFKDGFVK